MIGLCEIKRVVLSVVQVGALGLFGCDGAALDTIDTTGGELGTQGRACTRSRDCSTLVCAGVSKGGAPPREFACRSGCIEAGVQTLWCADSGSCCAGLSCSTEGFCVGPDEANSGDDGMGTGAEGAGDGGCPGDPMKDAPGECGCGVPDIDSDGDGFVDCTDACEADPEKTTPGVCGCGVPDDDTDDDGLPDCLDECPSDPDKTAPNACGCGVPDTDGDGDGVADCADRCPGDSAKTEPLQCGCGTSDIDSDGDGHSDCIDGCPADPAKANPEQCGCGAPDDDSDGDGVADCVDLCPGNVDGMPCGDCRVCNAAGKCGIIDPPLTVSCGPCRWCSASGSCVAVSPPRC